MVFLAAQNLILNNHDDAVRALAKQATELEQIGELDATLAFEKFRIVVSQSVEVLR